MSSSAPFSKSRVLLFAASYVVPVLVLGGASSIGVAMLPRTSYVIQVLWIWLLTFVLHYLMRNIQARQEAFSQHVKWQAVLASQLENDDKPAVQRQSVLNAAHSSPAPVPYGGSRRRTANWSTIAGRKPRP